MKNNLIFLVFLIFCFNLKAQNLSTLKKATIDHHLPVYYSDGFEEQALWQAQLCYEALQFMRTSIEEVPMKVELIYLSQADWKPVLNTDLIYGMPHFSTDGTYLIVAAEDNAFWKSQLPPVDQLSPEWQKAFQKAYTQADGSLSNRSFFDVLAIHELGHALHKQGKRFKQTFWLEEVYCNMLLHTFVAEKRPDLLPALETLPAFMAQIPGDNFEYRTLQQFETDYWNIGMKAPMNYGWYQFRFHHASKLIYDEGGIDAFKKLWRFLGTHREKLSQDALTAKLSQEVHPYFGTLIKNW
jgi:uncharacterized protein YdhG (YjbR/CyaY superfamily)